MTIEPADTRAEFRRDGGRRTAVFGFNVEGRNLDATIADARAAITRAGLLPTVEPVFGGIASAARVAAFSLVLAALVTLALAMMVLRSAFAAPRDVWLLLFDLPLMLGAAVRLITAFGNSTRNAIIPLSPCERLANGGQLTSALAEHGPLDRFVPIFMTVLVAASG